MQQRQPPKTIAIHQLLARAGEYGGFARIATPNSAQQPKAPMPQSGFVLGPEAAMTETDEMGRSRHSKQAR